MSIISGTSKDVIAILKMFGIDAQYTREVHIHIVANKPVEMDIVAYANIDLSQATILTRYNLIEIPNCEEIEEEIKAIEE